MNGKQENSEGYNPYRPPVTEVKVNRRTRKLSPKLREFYNREREYDFYEIAVALQKFRKYERRCFFGMVSPFVCFILAGILGFVAMGSGHAMIINRCSVCLGALGMLLFFVFTLWLYIICMPSEFRAVKRLNELMDLHVRNYNPFAFGDNQKYLAEALIAKHGYDPGDFWYGPELSQFGDRASVDREHF